MTLDEPILGGITTVMELLRALPEEALEARDVYGQSPFYMASSLGMEGLGRGILLRLAEVSGRRNDHHLKNRDLIGQTVLGASIIGGCSMQYLRFLIAGGAQVDPDPLTALPLTPLQAAALSGSSDIVRLLLGHGAEIDRVFHGNDTPLTLARRFQHADVIQQLSNAATAHSSPTFDLG
jgi:ankyrin repeat protein